MLSHSAKQKIQKHVAALPPQLMAEPASQEELANFESEHGLIPEDYRWFLLACGGGYFGQDRLDDIAKLAESHAKYKRELGPPRGWTMQNVFIIGWDGFGNPFGIDQPTGRIFLEDHNFGGIRELAPSLEAWMLKGIWT